MEKIPLRSCPRCGCLMEVSWDADLQEAEYYCRPCIAALGLLQARDAGCCFTLKAKDLYLSMAAAMSTETARDPLEGWSAICPYCMRTMVAEKMYGGHFQFWCKACIPAGTERPSDRSSSIAGQLFVMDEEIKKHGSVRKAYLEARRLIGLRRRDR